MRFPSVPGRRRIAVAGIVAVVAVLAGLLSLPVPAAEPAKSADQLLLSWTGDGDLRAEGAGFRPNGLAEVRLGSDPVEQARADDLGRVRVLVPRRIVAAGNPGASVTVIGRSKYGLARSLISAVPPRAAGRGPIDLLPWAVAAAALAYAVIRWCRTRRASTRRTPAHRPSGRDAAEHDQAAHKPAPHNQAAHKPAPHNQAAHKPAPHKQAAHKPAPHKQAAHKPAPHKPAARGPAAGVPGRDAISG